MSGRGRRSAPVDEVLDVPEAGVGPGLDDAADDRVVAVHAEARDASILLERAARSTVRRIADAFAAVPLRVRVHGEVSGSRDPELAAAVETILLLQLRARRSR